MLLDSKRAMTVCACCCTPPATAAGELCAVGAGRVQCQQGGGGRSAGSHTRRTGATAAAAAGVRCALGMPRAQRLLQSSSAVVCAVLGLTPMMSDACTVLQRWSVCRSACCACAAAGILASDTLLVLVPLPCCCCCPPAEEDPESAAAKEAPLSLPSAASMSMGSKRPAVLADGTYASQVRHTTGTLLPSTSAYRTSS
jgi:hypothetical protein